MSERAILIDRIAGAVGIRPDQVEAVICWLDEEAAAEIARVDAEEIDELARRPAWRPAGGPATDPGAAGQW